MMSSTTVPNPANGSFPSRSSRLSTGCNDQVSVKKYGVDLFDSELMNERSDLSKKNAVDLFHNTSMASGITLDSTFSNLLKDFIIRTLV